MYGMSLTRKAWSLFLLNVTSCGLVKNDPIATTCANSLTHILGPTNLTSAPGKLRQFPGNKPMWIGAALIANYSKVGLFDTRSDQWKFTEPSLCSGLAEFFNINGKYEVRLATSRACALKATQSTPTPIINISGENILDLGFTGYLSLKTENPRFARSRLVLDESFGTVSESIRTVLNDAGTDSYPYISIGNQLSKAKETELLRLGCHKETFTSRDEEAANPTPDACLPAFWMETSRNFVAAEDAIKYKADLDILVDATAQLRQLRLDSKVEKVSPEVTTALDALIDNFEQFQRAQEEIDLLSVLKNGFLSCSVNKPCPKDSRKNAFNIYLKYILPSAEKEITLFRDDPKNDSAQVIIKAKMTPLIAARDIIFSKLLEDLKVVSPILKDQSQNISILAHHQTTPNPDASKILFKAVPLFPKTPASFPELAGVLPSFDAGRLFIKFDTTGTNLQNELHDGSAVMLGNYPVTFLRVNQKQSGGASLINLPSRKSTPPEDEKGTADTSGTKATVGSPKNRSTSCAQ